MSPSPVLIQEETKARDYYGYLFQADRTPTETLDAFLRALGQYIINSIGNENDCNLSPAKLSAFYKAVGGNYDTLFQEVPPQSISYIWQATGCQHSLIATDDDFASPSVPVLTLKGFVRWESIELLLSPAEHVPYLQYAARNFSLRHPVTGQLFPVELSAEAFPSEPDEETESWHRACAEKLRASA
ncbi:hypothetical protein GQ53DRAFT_659214, partial [Thozetella sp. PMI_491]